MDLASVIPVTLQDSDVHCLPSDVWGLLGWGCSAHVIGQALTTKQGFFVLPRLIFTGEIQIMVWPPVPPCQISEEAQTCLFPVVFHELDVTVALISLGSCRSSGHTFQS